MWRGEEDVPQRPKRAVLAVCSRSMEFAAAISDVLAQVLLISLGGYCLAAGRVRLSGHGVTGGLGTGT